MRSDAAWRFDTLAARDLRQAGRRGQFRCAQARPFRHRFRDDGAGSAAPARSSGAARAAGNACRAARFDYAHRKQRSVTVPNLPDPGMNCQAARKRIPVAPWVATAPQPSASGECAGQSFRRTSTCAVRRAHCAWTPPFPSAQADGRPQVRQGRFQSLAAGASFPDISCLTSQPTVGRAPMIRVHSPLWGAPLPWDTPPGKAPPCPYTAPHSFPGTDQVVRS